MWNSNYLDVSFIYPLLAVSYQEKSIVAKQRMTNNLINGSGGLIEFVFMACESIHLIIL